jgi:Bacterial toxin 23
MCWFRPLNLSKGCVTILFLILLSSSFSQDIPYRDQNINLNAGLNISLGTHFQRVGVVLNAAYVNDHFQANAETRFYFNLRSLGLRKKHGEITTSLGVLYGYGKRNTWYNPFYNSVSNQTGYKYAVAYSYNAYWNKIRTSQRTGIVALQFDKITIINENDLWAPPSLDKFRTAGFLIQFQHDSLFQAAINFSMWTGKMGFQTPSTDAHFRFGCYMDTVGSIYPNYSHGLMSGQFKYYLGYGQNAQANIGIDAEQVRNVVQNKMIHDMRFLPKSWIKNKNCHIPMLDDKGNQYLYREDQKIRPAKFYFNVGGNEGIFY